MNIREAAEEIKRTVTMDTILSLYGIQLRRDRFISCPFHAGDHTASLKVYKGGRGWSCFGCHAGGTVIDFVMRMDGLGFADAVHRIDEALGLHLLEIRPVTPWGFNRKSADDLRMREAYQAEMDRIGAEIGRAEYLLEARTRLYMMALGKHPLLRTPAEWLDIQTAEYYGPEEELQLAALRARKEETYPEWAKRQGLCRQKACR